MKVSLGGERFVDCDCSGLCLGRRGRLQKQREGKKSEEHLRKLAAPPPTVCQRCDENVRRKRRPDRQLLPAQRECYRPIVRRVRFHLSFFPGRIESSARYLSMAGSSSDTLTTTPLVPMGKLRERRVFGLVDRPVARRDRRAVRIGRPDRRSPPPCDRSARPTRRARGARLRRARDPTDSRAPAVRYASMTRWRRIVRSAARRPRSVRRTPRYRSCAMQPLVGETANHSAHRRRRDAERGGDLVGRRRRPSLCSSSKIDLEIVLDRRGQRSDAYRSSCGAALMSAGIGRVRRCRCRSPRTSRTGTVDECRTSFATLP